ncbi:MAG TPA: carbamate kinase [Thermoanaerobaculia bacterium]|nr:carbamate kinase [Thermoanaerobaculia bacterium]
MIEPTAAVVGPTPEGRRLAVVAFGGNALLTSDDLGTVDEQKRRAEEAAEWLVGLVAGVELDLLIVHGNGPQVGQVLIQMEEAATKVPPGTLDVAVAQTEGGMGFLLETALRNRLAEVGSERRVATLLTLVVVDRDDPGFIRPTKPVGPSFSRWRAEALERDHGWEMSEDSGRGWRKVVASPRPLEVLGVPAMRRLLAAGDVVIAGGGGGIPVVRRDDGRLEGVEAVIDKDFTSALLARALEADLFLNLTGVAHVMADFGEPEERPLPVLSLAEARRLLAEGQFPAGSMGPKIRSAIEFVEATGKRVLITDIDHLEAAMAGESGTVIVADGAG